ALEPAVRDARRAPRTSRDLVRRSGFDLDAEDARGSPHDLLERFGLEQVELVRRAETVAQRRREPADARRGADERESRKRKPQCARAGPLADDDVELIDVHRRIEHFLHESREAMDLVDEEHLTGLEVGQDRSEVAGTLDRRPARDTDRHPELMCDDIRERRLPHSGWAIQRHMVERLAACLRRFDQDPQLALDVVLIDVFVVRESLRPKRRLQRALAFLAHRRRDVSGFLVLADHARALRTAPAMRSVAVARGIISASLALRGLSSTWSSFSVRFDTVARNGMPIRSASANFTPAVSSRSSYKTSTPACCRSATNASAAVRTASSFDGRAMT